jgi:hypothetical protein
MRVRSRSRITAALVLFAVTLTFALPAHARAQAPAPSLADLAKKEGERRKGIQAAGKVYTNKDLPKGAQQPAPAAPAAAAADKKPQEPAKPPEEEKNEAWWRARITSAREELRRNEMALEAFQTRVNSLSADFVNRDDPYQRAQVAIDRQKTLAELERVKSEVERVKKQIADIEEEARQAGVPPGWLR